MNAGWAWDDCGFSGPPSSALPLDAALRSSEYLCCRGRGGGGGSVSPQPRRLWLPDHLPIPNSPAPRGFRDPAGFRIAAGTRRTPVDPARTGTAMPPGAGTVRSRPPQPPLAECPAPQPGPPGPARHRDLRRPGRGPPRCGRLRRVPAPPAAATGPRSSLGGVPELAGGAEVPLPLPGPPQPPSALPLTRWCPSSGRWPRPLGAAAPGWAPERAAPATSAP